MARGGRRGKGSGRGKSRSVSAQAGTSTAGNGFAQSGGVSSTFQGTNGAGTSGKAPSAGGSRGATNGKRKPGTGLQSGNRYTVVTDTGDNALVPAAFHTRTGAGPNRKGTPSKGGSLYDIVYPKTVKGQGSQAGGSTQ